MNVLLIYPEIPATFWSFQYALKFVRKKASNPPLGIVTVAAMLPKEWNKKLVDMNVSELTDKDLEWADYAFISAMVVQRSSTHEVIDRCKAHNLTIVAGGPLFTGEYEKFEQIDHFILNEAELTLQPFLDDLAQGNPKRIYQSCEYADISHTPVPMWELVDLKQYDSLAIQFTRGCPFNCEFCNVTALLGHKVRMKRSDQIIAELDRMYELGWRRSIFFVDDNFIGNRKFLKQDLLPALIHWRKGKSGCTFLTEVSINLADDDELIEMMVDAGFHSVFIGIETPDEASLAECHKMQNKNRDLVHSVRKLQRAGIRVMGGFIVGFDNDTPSIFQRQVDFIQNSAIVTAMVGLLQAPFDTELYRRLKNEGRLIEEMSGDNSDGSTNIVPKMDIHLLKMGYERILERIYSPKPFYDRVRTFLTDYSIPRTKHFFTADELYAFFRSIYLLGFRSPERYYYWQLIFWTLRNFPKKLQLAITMAIYGYHFRKVSGIDI